MILDKIENYLGSGGLFNPELVEHEKVRDLIMDCRDEIQKRDAEIDKWSGMYDVILRREQVKDAEIENLRTIKSNQSDVIDSKSNKIKERDAEIVKLKKVSDMKSAIVEGMRRVCAIARMVNNQRPDVRMTAAFESYDISKLNNSHRAEIEKRDKLLDRAVNFLKFIEAKHDSLGQAKQWLKNYQELLK